MEHSKLEKHKFKKGKFITPWNDMLGNIGVMRNWALERFFPMFVDLINISSRRSKYITFLHDKNNLFN